jgi:hypothetical protein
MIALTVVMSEETGNWNSQLAATVVSQQFNTVHIALLSDKIICVINYDTAELLHGDVGKVNLRLSFCRIAD